MVALKQPGAERLLGKGDLFYSLGYSLGHRLWRFQAIYLPEAERRRIFQQSGADRRD